mmetsp:Transcript_8620/g.19949  ORF Transcript_8620/g.19949 Transcript_8620/m.19949 type:complete len:86 (-) Transcript_8620:175-432(-)
MLASLSPFLVLRPFLFPPISIFVFMVCFFIPCNTQKDIAATHSLPFCCLFLQTQKEPPPPHQRMRDSCKQYPQSISVGSALLFVQ